MIAEAAAQSEDTRNAILAGILLLMVLVLVIFDD